MLINNPNTGAAQIQYIPPVLIEKVESYPDITPVELGNANLAGAINFKTRNTSEEAGGQVSAAYGSFETQNYEASGWGGINGYNVVGGAYYLKSKNDFPVATKIFASPYKKRLNDGIEQTSVFLKGDKDWDHATASITAQYNHVDKGLPTVKNRLRDDATLRDINWKIQSLVDYQVGEWRLAHRLNVAKLDLLFNDINGNFSSSPAVIGSKINNHSLQNIAKTSVGNHQLAMGLELSTAKAKRFDEIDNELDLTGNREQLVASFANNWQATPNLGLNLTARYYFISDSSHNTESRLNKKTKSDDSVPSIQFGLLWQLSPTVALKSNLGQLVRIPTMGEKYADTGLFEGEPDLKPEISRVFDAGVI